MGLIAMLKEMMSSKPDEVKSAYPPAVIDWTKFEAAGVADARSPCPMLNALCNHHILPHDGRNISKEMAINALTKSLNLDAKTANAFASKAVTLNPDPSTRTFDLNHLHIHGEIEHDVSLSRDDAAFGDNHNYNADIWAKVIETYGDEATTTSFESVSRARYSRVKASRAAHEEAGLKWQYGIKELVLSYGESALFLSVLGDPVNGKIPLEYVRILFEQARVPYDEGWRRSSRPITQADMKHLISSLISANEEKMDEVRTVNAGTLSAVHSQVHSMLPGMCTVM